MATDRSMKSISEGMCPHCSKPLMISTQFTAPVVDWVLRPEDLKGIKAKMRLALQEVAFKNAEEKEKLLAWLDKEDTMICPDEFDSILAQIISDHTNVKSK